jgi:hypothetical protein
LGSSNRASYKKITGVNLLTAFIVSLIVIISVQLLEHIKGKPLFDFPGSMGYEKNHERNKVKKWTHQVEVVLMVIVCAKTILLHQ